MESMEKRIQIIIEKGQQNEQLRHYAATVERLKDMGFDAKPIVPQRDNRIIFPNTPSGNIAGQRNPQCSIPSFLY